MVSLRARIPLYFALIAILSACTPNTAGGVRTSQSAKTISFTANENYQPVYRKILEQSRKCNEGGLLTAQMVVKNDLYSDIKAGTISVEIHGGLGVSVYWVIDIKYLEEDESEIKTYFAHSGHAKHAEVIKKWVVDNYKECT